MASLTCFRTQIRRLGTVAKDSQLNHNLLYNPKITPPRQAWLENFIGSERTLLDIIDLHPKVFGVFPRLDFVSNVLQWQKSYRKINYISMPTRNELPGGTKKPWPQKGTGRAHHGSVNSPIFLKGGWAKGPRGPTTSYKVLPNHNLVNALAAMLTIKLAQDDLKIVDTITSYTSEDPQEFEESIAQRGWGPSVLIIDDTLTFPEQLMKATRSLNHINMMPIEGLNTLSMCKHETMIITLDALRKVEGKVLEHLLRVDLTDLRAKYRD